MDKQGFTDFKRHTSLYNPALAWGVLITSVLISALGYLLAAQDLKKHEKDQLNTRADDITQVVAERLSHYEAVLVASSAFFSASNKVSRDEWSNYVSTLKLKQQLPGIRTLGYIEAIPAAPEKTLERHPHNQGSPNDSGNIGNLNPPNHDGFTTSTVYAEPAKDNQTSLGSDMWRETPRRQAMEAAMNTGDAHTTSAIYFSQAATENSKKGFITFYPIYHHQPQTAEQRREQLKGWVYLLFDVQGSMQQLFTSSGPDIEISIYDGATLHDDQRLFSTMTPQAKAPLTVTRNVLLPGYEWTMVFQPTPKMKAISAYRPSYVATAGVVINLLLFYVVFSFYYVQRKSRKSSQRLYRDYLQMQKHLDEQRVEIDAAAQEADLLFNIAPEGFIEVDATGTIVRANPQAYAMLQYPEGELTGVPVDTLVPEQFRAQHHHLRDTFMQRPFRRIMASANTISARRADGSELAVLIDLVPMERAGSVHVLASIRDISVQKATELKLLQARDQAELASRAKSDFVANMSHEIRTPLNAVLGTAQLLSKSSLSQSQHNYLDMILRSGQALFAIINDILDFSKIEAGKLELLNEAFSLEDVLSSVASLMASQAADKIIEPVIVVASDVPDILQGDALRLQQILLNLTSNAIKFTEAGEVVLSVSGTPIPSVQEHSDPQWELVFHVKDTGIGMSQEQQERIFNAFTQADNSITRKFGGTGLGLVICTRLIDLFGGTLKLNSTEAQGSEFTVRIPFTQPSHEAPVITKGSTTPGIEREGPLIALLIAPHPYTALSLQSSLKRMGWNYVHLPHEQLHSQFITTLASQSFDAIVWSATANCPTYERFLKSIEIPQGVAIPPLLHITRTPVQVDHKADGTVIHNLVKPVTPGKLSGSLTQLLKGECGNVKTTKPSHKPLSGVSLLLVEDNAMNQAVAYGLLEDLGASVSIADNGKEALDMLRAQPTRWHTILMDIQMPVMDGITATQHIRNDLKLSTPVIAISAGVMPAELNECKAAGINGFVPKPIDQQQLLVALQEHLPALATPEHNLSIPSPQTQEATETAMSNTGTPIDASQFDTTMIDQLIKRKPERAQHFRTAVKTLCAEAPKQLEEGQKALESRDLKQAKFIFHSLKGSVGHYGAKKLRERLQQLEHTIEEDASYDNQLAQLNETKALLQNFLLLAEQWSESLQKNER